MLKKDPNNRKQISNKLQFLNFKLKLVNFEQQHQLGFHPIFSTQQSSFPQRD